MSDESEALILAADILHLVVRRCDENAIDALDMLRGQLLAWGERRIRPQEIQRNLAMLYGALRRTPRSARPGAFLRAYERQAFE